MDKVFYKEKQKYSSGFLLIAAIPLLAIVFVWYMDSFDPEITKDGFLAMIIIFSFMSIGLFLLFYKMRLEVIIKDDCIEVRYPPFRMSAFRCFKKEIRNWQVREFKPIKEFGGLGYKKQISLSKPSFVSYTVKGKLGLEIEMKNGKKVMLGTQRKQALSRAMRKWMEGK